MTGELIAAGEALTGGLVARTVEPGHGEGHIGHPEQCLNCRTPLTGPYCHVCGQRGHVHRTIAAFFHELGHGLLHFDGKVWRTLPMLCFRPGELTRRYVLGERAKFVSPLALFLFSTFLMFASFGIGVHGVPTGKNIAGKNGHKAVSGISFTTEDRRVVKLDETGAEIARLKTKLKTLEASRADALARHQPVEDLDVDIDELRDNIKALSMGKSINDEGVAGFLKKYQKAEVISNTGWKRFDEAVKHAIENPEVLILKIETNAHKFTWLLIPLSAPFVMLLFLWRRKFKLYDHVVFVTYSLAFMTILITFIVLLPQIGSPAWITPVLVLMVPPIHIYKQLKGAYSLGRFSALWRTSALLAYSWIALIAFLLVLLVLGVMT